MKPSKISALIAVLALAGCGVGGGNDPDPPAGPLQALGVQGAWRSSCNDAIVDGEYFGITKSSELRVSETEMSQTTVITESGRCIPALANVELTTVNTFKIKNPNPSGATEVDLHLKSYVVKPLNERGVQILKLANWCSVSDWKVGEPRDVTAKAGTERCNPPKTRSTVFTVENGRLYFGSAKPSLVKVNRVTNLDRELFFTRM